MPNTNTFDLTAIGNTIIKASNSYYSPIGINVYGKIIENTGYNTSVVSAISINSTPQTLSSVYNETTRILNIINQNFVNTVIVTATATPNIYTITYLNSDSTAFTGTHEANYPTSHTYGTETTLKIAYITGYTFVGWYASSSLTGVAKTTLGANDYSSNITLYAKFSYDTYNIVLNNNDGTTNSTSILKHYGDTYGTLPTPTRSGYTFKGWNGKNLFNMATANWRYDGVYGNGAYSSSTNTFTSSTWTNNHGAWAMFTSSDFVSGQQYAFSYYIRVTNQTSVSNSNKKIYINNSTSSYNTLSTITNTFQRCSVTFIYIGTTGASNSVHIYIPGVGTSAYIYQIKDMQIEESASVTPYEPYYLTASTVVTRPYDHAIKAIWQ